MLKCARSVRREHKLIAVGDLSAQALNMTATRIDDTLRMVRQKAFGIYVTKVPFRLGRGNSSFVRFVSPRPHRMVGGEGHDRRCIIGRNRHGRPDTLYLPHIMCDTAQMRSAASRIVASKQGTCSAWQ
jgi:hypothetical protein